MTKNRSKNEAKRKQILDAATVLFTEQGYAATSMDLIASKADVSKQTVYSHFGNKEDLFSASIQFKCDSYHILDATLEDLSNPTKALTQLAQRFLSILMSKEALAVHKVCAFESKTYPQLSELFYEAGPERFTNDVATIMTMLNKKNILAIPNARTAAIQFLNLMKGEAYLRVEFNTKKQLTQLEIENYLQSSVELFMKGYAV